MWYPPWSMFIWQQLCWTFKIVIKSLWNHIEQRFRCLIICFYGRGISLWHKIMFLVCVIYPLEYVMTVSHSTRCSNCNKILIKPHRTMLFTVAELIFVIMLSFWSAIYPMWYIWLLTIIPKHINYPKFLNTSHTKVVEASNHR